MVRQRSARGALQNHALAAACCIALECDPADVRCDHGTLERRLLLYDAAPGGSGLARQAYERLEGLLRVAAGLLADCGCTNGCPGCVFTSEAGCHNGSVCKRSGLALLQAVCPLPHAH